MSFEIDAVYENATLKLDGPLPLAEHQRVKVVVREAPNGSHETGTSGDWWSVLNEILASQKQRGFVGTVADVDRGDQGYEERMRSLR